MTLTPVRTIVIVGGGTAGWMTAATLGRFLDARYRVRLVESDEIGIIGVGEATIPSFKHFNQGLGIDENEFLRATKGTYKLGIEFVDWGRIGNRYIHGFAKIGHDVDGVPFHHYWLRMRAEGRASGLDAYSVSTSAPAQARYMNARPDLQGSPLGDLPNAFHFDASLYARYLRAFAEARGVQRTEGRIRRVLQREGDGHVTAVELDGGEQVAGDFFVDCSGIRALLIEQTLHAGFDDWTHWLPCDRAIAVPCARVEPLLPITRSTAHGAGWQWRIPLQHRIGNGHVYSSDFTSDDEAAATLLARLDGEQLAEPRFIRYVTGRRRKAWVGNCLAVGLSGGFLEPLESTSIHLIQTALARLVSLFPHAGLDAADIDEFNRQSAWEYERLRDFLIVHYKATERDDTPFWRACRDMPVPETVRHRMDLYRSNGRVYRDGNELFAESSWVQVMQGQGLEPRGYHPFADLRPAELVEAFLRDTEDVVRRCVAAMPLHADFVAATCSATP